MEFTLLNKARPHTSSDVLTLISSLQQTVLALISEILSSRWLMNLLNRLDSSQSKPDKISTCYSCRKKISMKLTTISVKKCSAYLIDRSLILINSRTWTVKVRFGLKRDTALTKARTPRLLLQVIRGILRHLSQIRTTSLIRALHPDMSSQWMTWTAQWSQYKKREPERR